MTNALGKLIKSARKKKKISQGYLCKLLKVKTPQSISNIERGVSPVPVKHVKILCKALHITPAVFYAAFVSDYAITLKQDFKKQNLNV